MHPAIITLFLLVAGWIFWTKFRNRNVRHVLPAQVREKLKDQRRVFLLDVRTEREVARRKMKGAVCIPLHEISSRMGELEPHREKQIVVVCATGSRSVTAARVLQSHGFDASSMRGGLMAWGD